MRALGLFTRLLPIISSFATLAASEPFESLDRVPQGWKQLGVPDASKRVQLRIALEQPNHDIFEQHLFAISTPGNPRYGQHMTREELKAILKPRDESTAIVLGWLKASGILDSDVHDDGDWIHFNLSIGKANQILQTQFMVYGNDWPNTQKIRTLQYSVPESVGKHITLIQPTTRFGQITAENSNFFTTGDGQNINIVPKQNVTDFPLTAFNATACNSSITPDCLRELYTIGDYEADSSCGSLFGVCGYLNQYAKYDALNAFLTKYAPYAKKESFQYQLISGGLSTQNDTDDDDGEANLDIQYAVSLSYSTPITYYSTGGLGQLVPDLDEPVANRNEPYLDFLHYILSVPDNELPQTITTSYGEDEQSVPKSYATEVCKLFGQLGARGVSVIFSSGDTGVGSACQTNDGTNTTRFLPIFPAACPYVTSVGATHHVQPEKAVSFSSGGFSDIFPRPSYQDTAVEAYLEILGSTWDGLYNPNGRGFPDVAAQGVYYHVIGQNSTTLQFEDDVVSGTSAAAPTFASIVSLLNNARLSAGNRPLGFLNPWIYSQGYKALTDITYGGSKGCTGIDSYSGLPTPFVPYASWNATTGWDPVTGYGTPNFRKMLEMVVPGYRRRGMSGDTVWEEV